MEKLNRGELGNPIIRNMKKSFPFLDLDDKERI